MTDPVDTNALRETALDLEPVRADERLSNTQWARVHIAKRALFGAGDEVDRLRALIAHQQHDDLCAVWELSGGTSENGCTCWKADAL